jgi:hypothetical protein
MINDKTSQKTIMKSVELFKNLKNTLIGLSKILQFNFDEDDFLYQAGIDNILALGKNIPEIVHNSQNASKLIDDLANTNYYTKNKSNKTKISH